MTPKTQNGQNFFPNSFHTSFCHLYNIRKLMKSGNSGTIGKFFRLSNLATLSKYKQLDIKYWKMSLSFGPLLPWICHIFFSLWQTLDLNFSFSLTTHLPSSFHLAFFSSPTTFLPHLIQMFPPGYVFIGDFSEESSQIVFVVFLFWSSGWYVEQQLSKYVWPLPLQCEGSYFMLQGYLASVSMAVMKNHNQSNLGSKGLIYWQFHMAVHHPKQPGQELKQGSKLESEAVAEAIWG